MKQTLEKIRPDELGRQELCKQKICEYYDQKISCDAPWKSKKYWEVTEVTVDVFFGSWGLLTLYFELYVYIYICICIFT